MSESDADSEADRRAYGQYPSLGVDSDVDEEAAAYLRAVREEARALPDVVTVPSPAGHPAEPPGQAELPEADGEAQPAADDISAGPAWVRSFMKDFLDVRLRLQSLELHGEQTPGTAAEDPAARPPGLIASLTGLLSLDPGEVGALLEERVDRLAHRSSLATEDAYGIFALAAALEHPPGADAEACFGVLLRHCRRLRAAGVAAGGPPSVAAACLDVLQAIAGAYFGQDAALRAAYREHGVHV